MEPAKPAGEPVRPDGHQNLCHDSHKQATQAVVGVEFLVEKASKSTFVAIDIGNHENKSDIDIGIAILPAFPEVLLDAPLDSSGVGALASKHHAIIHNFCTPPEPEKQAPGFIAPTNRTEQLLWGTEDVMPAEKIEAELVIMLQGAQVQADLIGNDLVLVVFDWHNDLKTIAKHFPRVLPFFAWWVDIQPIVMKMDASYERTNVVRPSLGDTMKSLGYTSKIQGGVSPKFHKHKSSNDAARTLAALAGVVQRFRAGQKFDIQENRPPRRSFQPPGAKQFTRRPQPDEMYPFVAKIEMDEEGRCVPPRICHLPREWAERNLWAVFDVYRPNALGRNGVGLTRPERRHTCTEKCSGWCLWISVPTREMLEQLIRDLQGKELQDGRLRVEDISLEDAEAPMSRQELVAKLRASKTKS